MMRTCDKEATGGAEEITYVLTRMSFSSAHALTFAPIWHFEAVRFVREPCALTSAKTLSACGAHGIGEACRLWIPVAKVNYFISDVVELWKTWHLPMRTKNSGKGIGGR